MTNLSTLLQLADADRYAKWLKSKSWKPNLAVRMKLQVLVHQQKKQHRGKITDLRSFLDSLPKNHNIKVFIERLDELGCINSKALWDSINLRHFGRRKSGKKIPDAVPMESP